MVEEDTFTREADVVQKKHKRKKKGLLFWLLLSLGLVVGGAFGASAVNKNGFQTDLSYFKIPTDDGQYVKGSIFKPKTATSANKAPCVVFVPGFQRTKESHYDICLELARRGIVSMIIDPYNQGDSSPSYNTSSSSSEAGAYGAIPLVNYLYDTDNVNYIDKNQISIAGHSAGGNSTMTAGVYFSNLAGGVYENCKVKSIYVSGYIRNIISADPVTDENDNPVPITYTDDEGNVKNVVDKDGETCYQYDVDWEGSKVANLAINVGFGYAEKDEGAWQNINGTGDISRPDSIEAIALITSGGNNLELRDNNNNTTGLIPGHVYGQPSNGTMKVGYQEHTLHGCQPFDIPSTAHLLYFFDMVYQLDHGISPNNQIWPWKQALQCVMMIGLFMAIYPICGLLLQVPCFKSVCQPDRTPKDAPKWSEKKGLVTWVVWLVSLALGASMACFSFVPLADLSKVLFADAAAHKVTWFFPERMNNAIMLWAVVNGAFGFCLFFLGNFITKKLTGEGLDLKEHFGIGGWKNVFKTILVAVLTWAGFYLLVHLMDYLFMIDARFTFVAVRTTNRQYLVYELMYLPFFFVFYFSNSVRTNLSAISNNANPSVKWRILNYVFAVLANTIGLIAIFAIQYLSIADHGLMYWTTDWLYTNMLWLVIPMMAVLPILQKVIYKRCHNIYLGAIVTVLILVTISMVNSVAHGYFAF